MSGTKRYRHYVPKIKEEMEKLFKDPNLTNGEVANRLNEMFPGMDVDAKSLSQAKYRFKQEGKVGASDKYSKNLLDKFKKEYREFKSLVRNVEKKYKRLERLGEKIEKYEKKNKAVKEPKQPGPYDDIIMAGFHNKQGEILSMIYSEDEEAGVSYNWVGVRKAALKKKHDVPEISLEETEEPQTEISEKVGHPDAKMGRPISARTKYIEGNFDMPNDELAKILNEKFPYAKASMIYVSNVKRRIKKRLGIEEPIAAEEQKPAEDEKKPVKVDYAHKDVLEPENIVMPKTGRRGRPPSQRMKFIEENLDMDSAALIDETQKRFPGTTTDYVYTIKSMLKRKVETERKMKSQTHIDTYEEKVEEPEKDYDIPAWKIPLKQEVGIIQPTVGIMKSTYVPTEDMKIIDLKTFSIAIKNSIEEAARAMGYDGVTYDQACEMAQHVLNFFGYSDVIIDNVLEQDDRDAFYMLQDADLLRDEREETTLYDGREWRIHYWILNRKRINDLAKNYHPQRTNNPSNIENAEPEQIYNEATWNEATKRLHENESDQLTTQERNDIYRKKRRGELYVSSQPIAKATS